MRLKLKPPTIPDAEKSSAVMELLTFIEQQASIIEQLSEEVQKLKDEIARLKNQPPKPNIRPSSLEPNRTKKANSKTKRPGSKKRKKTKNLQIHQDQPIEPEHIPGGSEFQGYRDFVVQDIKLESYNIRYRLKVYRTPDGDYVVGKLPNHLNGKHFGPVLIRFILYQYYHCHVTQPLLLEQLDELGVDISSGKLNEIITENKERFHQEKDEILAAGIEVASYINVDDTGARHKGKNGYCTHIGNESFSWFESTESKSRVNFLKLIRSNNSDYTINKEAICYMHANKLPQYVLKKISSNLDSSFDGDRQWLDFLTANGIVKERHIQIVTEGSLIGSIVKHGISDKLVIISDDAGQFNVLRHALCWIHAERTIDKIIPFTEQAKEDLTAVKDQIWQLYDGLKRYKQSPNATAKRDLKVQFDTIFTQKTHSATLNKALKRLHNNKSELLLVLERPDIPLHNNGAERAIREYVKRRKISGSTRSEAGRRCRDTFTSLKKTCRKLGISFWQYLKDRIEGIDDIPPLPETIRNLDFSPG